MFRVSAQQVYSVISPHQLTQEQLAAVEGASLTSPTLVIAGAGSGKTELMTVRIMFLVANGFATPDQILGLTFTKKAASELSARVLRSLYLLRETEFWPKDMAADFLPPTITTYNSFGNEIFRLNALAVGYEPDSQVLTDSGAIALAKDLLKSLDLESMPALADWEKSAGYLIEKLLSLSGELTDNQASVASASDVLQRFIALVSNLPKTPGGSTERFAYTDTMIAEAQANQLFLALAERYQALKQERNLVDFSDQVALALKALPQNPEHNFRFVMLDEYQDTSSIQTRLLARMFKGLPVMAVGDPNQAIYGWRGASDANLAGFAQDFGAAETITLSTCWRSGRTIVEAANAIASDLNQSSPLTPITLTSIKESDAIEAEVFQTLEQEAQAAADFFGKNLSEDNSAALLLRTKSSMSVFVRAIQQAGLEVEVTGLSGLTDLPEVVDLISALRVISDPQAATELIRLLSGPRWMMAPHDIAQLANYARKLSRIRSEVTGTKPITLVEALDELRKKGSEDYINISQQSFARLSQAAELFHQMRTQLSLSITELAWAVVRDLNIDIELFAHSHSKNPLLHLEQFISRLTEYEASTIRPTLSGLLQWLDYALEHESFELPKSGSKKGVVQVMSVHAAKGLEWDVVLVGQLNNGSFPIDSKDAKGWLAAGKLPFELRGDSSQLPEFHYLGVESQKELKANFDQFQDAMRSRSLKEERRLAYVAITRAAKKLKLTASYYKPGAKNPKAISGFLAELIEGGHCITELPEPLEQNPLLELAEVGHWPSLKSVSPELARAAKLASESDPNLIPTAELALLLEERERSRTQFTPKLPVRLSASAIVSLLEDPAAFLKSLRRPMPSAYSEAASRGTSFHSSIEDYFSSSDNSSMFAEDPTELDLSFLNSRYAGRRPAFIEQSIEFVLAETIVVCKLDAVFEEGGLYEVVDWKSGKAPSGVELKTKAIQLALYRIALGKWLKVPVERIRASFFYAGDGKEVSPDKLLSEKELFELLEDAKTTRLG
jgi:DNA helicase II / ATP-dependent DNA helicase PcrA